MLGAWKADPPDAFSQRGFRLRDEAYDTLVYDSHYYDWPAKLLFVTTFGVALLFKGFMGSSFQLTVRFDAEGSTRTNVTIIGRAHPRTRRRLTELANENGGPVGLRVGV